MIPDNDPLERTVGLYGPREDDSGEIARTEAATGTGAMTPPDLEERSEPDPEASSTATVTYGATSAVEPARETEEGRSDDARGSGGRTGQSRGSRAGPR